MEQLAEALERLFDSCDELDSGKVLVSTLITAMRNEVFKSVKDSNITETETLLQSIRDILDPLQQDTLIDKVTWTKAWQSLENIDSCSDALCDGPLDQSKQSYCFSPGSRSSSLDTETEDVTVLNEENEHLRNSLKSLKEQLKTQEDALILEQSDRRELEINYASSKNQITKLTKQVKQLLETNEELQSALDLCERTKDKTVELLHKTEEQLHKTEYQLREQSAAKNNEIALLNKEIEDLNFTIDALKCQINELNIGLSQEIKTHRDQIKEFQDAMRADQEEMSVKMTHALFQKRDLAARLEECDFSGIDLESELTDLSQSLEVDMKSETALLSKLQSTASSTPRLTHIKPIIASSLLDEMQAMGSGIPSSSILDCSFDVQVSSHCSASESDDSLSSKSSGCDEEGLESKKFLDVPLISSIKVSEESPSPTNIFSLQNNEKLLPGSAIVDKVSHVEAIPNLHADFLMKANPETQKDYLIADKCINTFSLNSEECALTQSINVGTQSISCKMIEMETQTHLTLSEIGIQTCVLNCDMETQTLPPIVGHVGTQISPEYVDMKISSIHAQVREVGIQTLPENFEHQIKAVVSDSASTYSYQPDDGISLKCDKCSFVTNMSKETALKEFPNIVEQLSNERIEKGTQTVNDMLFVHKTKSSHPQDVAKPSNQFEESSTTHKFSSSFQQNLPTNQHAVTLSEQKKVDMDCLVHSTVIEKHKIVLSEKDLPKKRFKYWAAIIIFVCLYGMIVMSSTVLLTAGILETLSQSGLISGSSPRWFPQLSYLVKPFLRIEYRTREPIL